VRGGEWERNETRAGDPYGAESFFGMDSASNAGPGPKHPRPGPARHGPARPAGCIQEKSPARYSGFDPVFSNKKIIGSKKKVFELF
jgi:hypothetical protein